MLVSPPAYASNEQGAATEHEIQKKIRRRREKRKARSKGQSKDNKDDLAAKDAGIEKPISRRAKEKAKKQASEEKEKKREEEQIDFSIIDAQSLIEEATRIPSGFQFPRDQARVEAIANSLAIFGQDRLVGLSETATANSTSIVWEAFQEEL